MNKNPYLCFYGDDFTGATDALDALYTEGVKAALVLDPTFDAMAVFPDLQAIGLAGMSRTMSPAQMDNYLPDVFAWMASLNPRVAHYKVCSTFDSSPTIGSIGHAIQLAAQQFGEDTVPIIVGAPRLGRYVAFGNLFARAGSDPQVHRLDRHPVMSHHPVTPMLEADLGRHLSLQTSRPLSYLTLVDLDAGRLPERAPTNSSLICDTTTPAHVEQLGRWLDRESTDKTFFCVGSSVIESALSSFMQGRLDKGGEHVPQPRGPIVVVSGSCSPVTAQQIDKAIEAGFASISVPAADLVSPSTSANIRAMIANRAVDEVNEGRSVLIYTAHGAPDIDEKTGIGEGLGEILRGIIDRTSITRVCVAGGDTSGTVTRLLDVAALTVKSSISPGAPLCTGHMLDGRTLEIALKGGQMGSDKYFIEVRDC
jgi:uncharacterized protein YgbK (DUF1537 family)